MPRDELERELGGPVETPSAGQRGTSHICLFATRDGSARARLEIRPGKASTLDTVRELQQPPGQDLGGVGDRAFSTAHYPAGDPGSGVTIYATRGNDFVEVSVARAGANQARVLAAAKRLAVDLVGS